MRIVLDTNVLLAGFATHGLCEGLVAICLRDHSVAISEYILEELAEHHVSKFKAKDQQVAVVLNTLRQQAVIVVPAMVAPDAVGDADDLPVLGTAIAGNADYLVTGDRGLLALQSFRGIPIVTPRAHYDLICASD